MPDEPGEPSSGGSHRVKIDGAHVKVTLVTTFRNEENGIESFLDSIFGQSRLPDELVLVDGGSSDRTVSLVEKYTARGVRTFPVRLIVAGGSNISAGRNRGIREASHEVVAVTDAGCVLEKDWLKCIVIPIEQDPEIDIVAGSYRVEARGLWERVSSSYLMPDPDLVSGAMPSGRSTCFRKRAWEEVGGYPEWLDHAEDSYFAISLREGGFHFFPAPEALVLWRPRPGPLSFFRQYFRYAVGDAKAGLYRSGYIRKILMYTLGTAALVLGMAVPLSLLVVLYFLIMMGRYWARGKDRALILFLPPVVVVHDIAQVTGYLYGMITGRPEK